MKKVFLALMAVAAIAMAGCEGRHYVDDPNEKEPPENEPGRVISKGDTKPQNQYSGKACLPARVPFGQDPYYSTDN